MNNILLNIIKISFLTCIVKIIGFIKDIIIANKFGINSNTDSFYTSIKIQNIFRRIITEGTLLYIFIPILSKYKLKKNKKKIEQLISTVYLILILLLFILTIICIIFSNKIILIIYSGFKNNYKKLELTQKIFNFTIPFILLISLSYFLASILNLWNIIYPIITIQLITNINIILFSIFISKYFYIPITSLSIAMIIGGIIQLTIQRIYIKQIPIKINISKINFLNKGIFKIIKKFIPTISNILIYQISQIINNNLSSYFKEGSISWIYYADKLIEFPLSILSTITGTWLLSKLSNEYNKKNINKYNKLIEKYLQIILLLSIPISIFFLKSSKLLIITLFKYGKFKYLDVIMTSKILIIYSIGLTISILNKIFISCYYSQQKINIPNKISIFILIFSQILNIFTIKIFKYIGISLSIIISSYLNCFLLYKQLIKKKMFIHKYQWKKFIIKIIISNILIFIFLNKLNNKLEINFIKFNFYKRIIYIIFSIIYTIIIYILSLFLLKINKEKFFN